MVDGGKIWFQISRKLIRYFGRICNNFCCDIPLSRNMPLGNLSARREQKDFNVGKTGFALK
jgi:hypothetical protein